MAERIATATRVVPLNDAVDVNPRPDRGALPDDLDVSFVPMAAVEAATGRMDATTVRRYGDVKRGYTVFREGDVLFAKITPCMENGKMAVARGLRNGIGCGSTEFHVLRPKPGVDAQYIFHFVSSARLRAEAARQMTGAVGQKRVPAAFLEQCEIPLPDLEEQRRIVAEVERQFSRLDEAVANVKRTRSTLKRYKAAVLEAAVKGRLVPTEAALAHHRRSSYETGEQLLDRIVTTGSSIIRQRGGRLVSSSKASGLGSLPDGWTWATYGLVGRLQLGRQRAPKYHSGSNMRPYLRVQNVFEDRLDLSDVKEMDFPSGDFQKYVLEAGDLLLNEGQSPELLGRPAIYRGELPGACFTNTLIRLRAASGVRVEFALLVARHHMHSGRFVDEGSITTNIAHLSVGRLSAVEFPLPPSDEQDRIVAEADRQFSIIAALEQSTALAERRVAELRGAILTSAFSLAP